MAILEPAKDFYDYLCSDIDPRVQDWLFMQNPLSPTFLIILYLLFVYLGPKSMKNRKPMQLQPLLVFYNFSLVILSAFIVHEFLVSGWLYDYSLGCQPVDYSNTPKAIRMAGAVWLFFIVKFLELFDTVFFILRKKNQQVTFLHVFHHGCLPMFWWWGVKAVPGGFGTFHGLVNACVHVVMYLYYGIAALGPKYQKYIWWKRYVTVFQLTQFFIVTIHNSQYLFMKCSYPWVYVAFIQGFTTIIAVLFLNFYIKTYRRTPRDHQETKSIYSSNGYHANGNQNGFVKNGYHPSTRNGLKRRPLKNE